MSRVDVADLLAELVSVASPSGSEAALAEHTAARLAAGGLAVERVGDSVVARLVVGAGGPRFLFNSHLDTVPVGAGWTHDPSGAEGWVDGRFFGRGANDAKASVAAMMAALLELAADPADLAGLDGELLLALTACEETRNTGMGDVLAHLGPPDGAVTGEPTGLEVVRAQSGLAVLRAVWSGRSCHAAHVARVEHVNAMLEAARDLAAVAPWFALEGAHPLLGESTVVASVFRGGERHNVVPDRAEVLFDARLAPPHGAADVVRELERRLPNATLEVHSERLRAVETAAHHPLVVAAVDAAGRSAAVGSSTLSDMALLSGLPTIKCGPGQSARSHTPDEFVLEAELLAGRDFYRALGPRALEALAPRPARGATP